MFSRVTFSRLGSQKKKGSAHRYFVQGKGEIKLTKADFRAQGGEGSIYVKGSTAYKIYSDPSRAIRPAKMAELAVLSEPNIIRPIDLVLNGKNEPAGYSMRHVDKSYALCQLFPKAFRQRNNLTPDRTLRLVRRLQEGVTHIHHKGILIVDLNELNFLVAQDFGELFFIDVDSYQTASFPAKVLMESVRDRHAQTFTVESDWFSFAVVSFQMFVGIHPYKGGYPPMQHLSDTNSKLDARMRANISVLHDGVKVPISCLNFSLIPPAYLDWYRAMFEEGKRLPPPESVHAALTIQKMITRASLAGSAFVITELREFDSPIISHDGLTTITQSSIYFEGKKYPKPPFDVRVVISPRQRHLVVAYTEGSGVRFQDLTSGHEIVTELKGEALTSSGGQLFIKQGESLLAIDFIELPNKILLGVRAVANVTQHSTQMFDGVAIQSLLGATYVSIPTKHGGCHQVRLPELDSHKIVDARLERNVLVVARVTAGQYDKLVYRFSKDFDSYDVRVISDVATSEIDLTVLDSGVVLHVLDGDSLEVFSNSKGSTKIRSISDPILDGDVKLFHTGKTALLGRENKLYKIELKS